jgi:hypothetical protein
MASSVTAHVLYDHLSPFSFPIYDCRRLKKKWDIQVVIPFSIPGLDLEMVWPQTREEMFGFGVQFACVRVLYDHLSPFSFPIYDCRRLKKKWDIQACGKSQCRNQSS